MLLREISYYYFIEETLYLGHFCKFYSFFLVDSALQKKKTLWWLHNKMQKLYLITSESGFVFMSYLFKTAVQCVCGSIVFYFNLLYDARNVCVCVHDVTFIYFYLNVWDMYYLACSSLVIFLLLVLHMLPLFCLCSVI